jgi:hypothetical protein
MMQLVDRKRHNPIETVRLSDREKHRLITQINERYCRQVRQDRRGLRMAYHADNTVISVVHPNGSETLHVVVSRDLSWQGMSFIAGRFIYPDSLARFVLDQIIVDQTDIDAIHCRINELIHTLRWVSAD